MNKKLLIVSIFLLFSKEVFSETYSCSDTLGPFALKRADTTDFEYHREGMIHTYYRINIETEEYIFLSRDDLKFGVPATVLPLASLVDIFLTSPLVTLDALPPSDT